MFAKWIATIGLAAALCCTSANAQTPASVIHLDFKADVQADGVPANIQPDAALAPPLQAMVRKRVAAWRYRMGTWQGKPVSATVSQRIVAEVVPVASGGFALRIKDVVAAPVVLDASGAGTMGRMFPPRYPEAAQRQGIEATMIYAMRRDAEGMPLEVELVEAQLPGNWRKPFDAVSRQAIQLWRLKPVEVEGQAIDCRLLTPVTFRLLDDRGPPPPLPEEDMRAYLPRFPDACPLRPVLESKAAGTLL
jgi:hypothetical protein